MKFNLKKVFTIRRIVTAAVNFVCISGAAVFCMLSDIQTGGLTSQNGAERWQNGSDNEYVQISCFFSDDSGMNEDSVNAARGAVKTALSDASLKESEGSRLWIDAYSTSLGKYEVSGNKRGTAKTEITAVTSDFFLIHGLDFVNGSYFREGELSENGIVIDRGLAWQIFGSDDVAGLTVDIDSVSFYVAGVVDIPQCSAEKKTYGNLPRAYIPYSMAEKIYTNYTSDDKGIRQSIPVECYETVMPNPVKNFAYNTLNKFTEEQYENTAVTVQNTDRFSLPRSFNRLRHLSESVVISNSVSYPWWENAARVTDVKVSLNLFAVMVFLIIPVITLAVILVRIFKRVKSKHIVKNIFIKIKDKF